MALKHSYTLLAPIYDLFVDRATRSLRKASLENFDASLSDNPEKNREDYKVLLCGIGSGLDIPHLPEGPEYVGIDITPSMLRQAHQRIETHKMRLDVGDVMDLPYDDESFDYVIMHLILAVVPDSQRALLEVERILKPGGKVFIADKFLRPGQLAPIRRLISPAIGQIATQTNVVFEDVISQCEKLETISDVPALGNGWFRRIVLQKKAINAD